MLSRMLIIVKWSRTCLLNGRIHVIKNADHYNLLNGRLDAVKGVDHFRIQDACNSATERARMEAYMS